MGNKSTELKVELDSIAYKDIAIHKIPTENKNVGIEKIPYAASKVLSYTRSVTGGIFESPEYNLYQIAACSEVDGIVKQTIEKKSTLMLKNGFRITGDNENYVKYIKLRLKQIELSQNKPWDILHSEIATDLISYHNAFLVKVRNDKYSGGNIRKGKTKRAVKDIHPVAAYFRLPAESVRFMHDSNGQVIKYKQEMPSGKYKIFNKDEVIHFYHSRRAGYNMACPGIWPALDDIRFLRKIEEGVELLTQQYLFPFFVFTIGTDEEPAHNMEDGTPEVEYWKRKIMEMPSDGGIVVTNRQKMEYLTGNKVLPVEEYLNYAMKRVFLSLGISPVDLGVGDTSNKATSETLSRNLIDSVKSYQRTYKSFFEFEIISELLLEKFDMSSLLEENFVKFEFSEIDTETMIKLENHSSLMYQQNMMTEDETRTRSNHKKLSDEERKGLYLHKVTIPQGEAAAKQKETAATKQAKSRQQPSNQHGKSTGPTKRKSSIEKYLLEGISIIQSDDMSSDVIDLVFSVDATEYGFDFADVDIDTVFNIIDSVNGVEKTLATDILIDNLTNYLIGE